MLKPRQKTLPIFGIGIASIVIFMFFIVTPYIGAETGSDDDAAKYKEIFDYIYQFIKNYYVEEKTARELYEGAIRGLFYSLDDPYSYYMSAEDMENLADTAAGEYAGVGLQILKPEPGSYDPETYRNNYPQFVEIIAPIEDSPAFKAGIHAGDFITKINDEVVIDLDIEEVKNKIRGPEGTAVTLTILRGKSIEFDVTLTRATISLPSIKYAMIGPDESGWKTNNIGYIRIIEFSRNTIDDIKEILNAFKKTGYNALIIDVRNNPGGLLPAVVPIADYFLSSGTIVSTRSRIPSDNKVYTAQAATTLVEDSIPIIILTNGGSASASEILAGAIKENNRGVIIGTKTYGKGSVQTPWSIGTDIGFKLTIALYFTPDGKNIDKIGIEPDIEVKPIEFTTDEEFLINKLYSEKILFTWVESHKNPTDSDIQGFIEEIQNSNYPLSEKILKRLITQEVFRTMDFPPVYDLDWDNYLTTAIDYLKDSF